MAGISLKGLTKSYGTAHVIKGVDIQIEEGEFCVFVGPSGCGKSTLLRMIAGLEDISGGDLTIGGNRVNDLPPSERGVAMVFQSYAIFPHMTVRENVAFGLTIAGAPKAEKEAKVAEAARILQMEHLLDRRPSQLSGGQSCASPRSFCSTNRCRTWMPRCAWTCGWRSASCTINLARR